MGRYVRSLIASMPAGEEEFLYLESRWRRPGALPEGAAGRRLRLLRPPRAVTLFDQLATPFLCRLERIDLFHSTFYALPRLSPARTRMVLTVHDLIPVLMPGATGPRNTAIFREVYRSARTADAVIVPSRRTAADLEERFGIPAGRIRIIPMGVGAPFGTPGAGAAREPAGAAPSDAARAAASAVRLPAGARRGPIDQVRPPGGKVLFYAGGFDPSKNVPFLFEALRLIREPGVVLCIGGDAGAAEGSLRGAVARAGLAGRVFWLGRLSDADLAASYRAADLFVSASIHEGFGLPPLEAMACGCPVVALTSGAVPEVLEGAALGVEDPSAGAFAAAVRRALEEETLRQDLIARGLARAADLTWERTARATLALYRELGGATGEERAG